MIDRLNTFFWKQSLTHVFTPFTHADLGKEDIKRLMSIVSWRDWIWYCLVAKYKKPFHLADSHFFLSFIYFWKTFVFSRECAVCLLLSMTKFIFKKLLKTNDILIEKYTCLSYQIHWWLTTEKKQIFKLYATCLKTKKKPEKINTFNDSWTFFSQALNIIY